MKYRMWLLWIAVSILPCLAADGPIRRLAWQVETSDPVERHWELWYGETVDMEIQYLDHRRPMDFSGVDAVVLHARTNGMEQGISFQTAGTVVSAQTGQVKVRVVVDSLLPPGLPKVNYIIAVTAGETNLLAATGELRMRGSGVGLAGSPLPAPAIATLASAIESNRLAIVAHIDDPTLHLSPAQVARIEASLTNETDSIALHALATQRIDRVQAADGSAWIDATGGVWQVEHVQSPAVYELHLSADFSTKFGDIPSPGVPLVVEWPWEQVGEFGRWVGYHDGIYYAYVLFIPNDYSYNCTWQGDAPGGVLDGVVMWSYTEDFGTATIHLRPAIDCYVTNHVGTIALTSQLSNLGAARLMDAQGGANWAEVIDGMVYITTVNQVPNPHVVIATVTNHLGLTPGLFVTAGVYRVESPFTLLSWGGRFCKILGTDRALLTYGQGNYVTDGRWEVSAADIRYRDEGEYWAADDNDFELPKLLHPVPVPGVGNISGGDILIEWGTKSVTNRVAIISSEIAPSIIRDGLLYRQYWDTNLLTTAWEPVP